MKGVKNMNKKVALVLSLLCLASCANSGNGESPSSSEQSKEASSSEQSSIAPTPSSSQSESKEDPPEDKEALFSQLKTGFVDFASYDDDVTFDFSMVATEEIEGVEASMRMAGEGTLDRENGLYCLGKKTYFTDPSTKEEVEADEDYQRIGLEDGKYSYYTLSSGDKDRYEADKGSAKYLFEYEFMGDIGVEYIGSVVSSAESFSAFSSALKYKGADYQSFACDIGKEKDGRITLKFAMETFSLYNTYDHYKIEYALAVKDGYLSNHSAAITSKTIYPDKTETKETTQISVNFSKGFDQALYSSFSDQASYVDSGEGMQVKVRAYYNGYYYDSFYSRVGGSLDYSYSWNDLFEGVYYDEDYTIPASSRTYSSDVREVYIKLNTTVDSSKAILYVLTDETSYYPDDVLPKETEKTLDAYVKTSASTYTLSWKNSDPDDRKRCLESYKINGIATSDNSFSFNLGSVYLIEHAYSRFSN